MEKDFKGYYPPWHICATVGEQRAADVTIYLIRIERMCSIENVRQHNLKGQNHSSHFILSKNFVNDTNLLSQINDIF